MNTGECPEPKRKAKLHASARVDELNLSEVNDERTESSMEEAMRDFEEVDIRSGSLDSVVSEARTVYSEAACSYSSESRAEPRVRQVQILSPNSGSVTTPGQKSMAELIVDAMKNEKVRKEVEQLQNAQSQVMEIRSTASQSDEYLNMAQLEPAREVDPFSILDRLSGGGRSTNCMSSVLTGNEDKQQRVSGPGERSKPRPSTSTAGVETGEQLRSAKGVNLSNLIGPDIHYHVFAHLDDKLVELIMEGKYIDFAKLLVSGAQLEDEEDTQQVVNRGGVATFVPVRKA